MKLTDEQKKEYKPVPGFEEYIVNRVGTILSPHRVYPVKGHTDSNGRRYTRLRRKYMSVAHIVALAWIPNPRRLPLVRHLDDNPANDCADNLAWGDWLENTLDAVANGKLRGVWARNVLNSRSTRT